MDILSGNTSQKHFERIFVRKYTFNLNALFHI